MAAYYSENDEKAAAWLRELIKAGLVADGEVDTRSIEDVRPDDLRGFVQCHFFAGIGGWSRALRMAGWPDDRSVWTGSCPCQPYSAAGKGDGFADERHLWPAWYWLIGQRRPLVVFGEQVESPLARAWLDLVSTDLEAAGYACGPSDLPIAGVGAPGIRQRLFWVADTGRRAHERLSGSSETPRAPGSDGGEVEQRERRGPPTRSSGALGGLADITRGGLGIDRSAPWDAGHVDERESAFRLESADEGQRGSRWTGAERASGPQPEPTGRSSTGRLVDRLITRLEGHSGDGGGGYESRRLDADAARSIAASGATRGAWSDADWLYCRDDKFRPVEPGTFPLAHGVPNRVVKLRGYGNAINPEVAQAFIETYIEARGIA